VDARAALGSRRRMPTTSTANAVIIPVRNVVCPSTWLTWRSAEDCSPIAAVATTASA
jgi:hypothetical protein